MVDDLRRELIQVERFCKGIVLDGKDINKILNGKYKEVIEDWQKEPIELDEIALDPAPQPKSPTMVEDQNDEDIESPSLSNYESPIYEPPQSV